MGLKLWSIFTVLFFWIIFSVDCNTAVNAESARKPQKRLSDLKLRIMVGRKEDADFFNKVLREDDLIFTYGAKRRYLERITVPKKMFGRGNLSALEAEFEKLGDVVVDYIHYNPEQWKESHTPPEEVNDLVAAVKKARILANKKNVKLSFGTDHILLERYGEKIAPLVDMFGIQLQRYQRETLEQFRKEAEKKVSIVRKGSKTVPIIFQVSLAPPMWKIITKQNGEMKKVIVRDKDGKKLYEPIKLEKIIEQIEAIKDLGDGLAFLYTEETRDSLRRLILQLRK